MLSFCQSGRDREVTITGVGVVCPLGIGLKSAWQRLLLGPSACRSLTPDELAGGQLLSRVPGLQLHGAPVDHERVRESCRRLPVLQQLTGDLCSAVLNEPVLAMTTLALAEALQQAGLTWSCTQPQRTGVLFGGSKGGLATAERLQIALRHSSESAAGLSDAAFAAAFGRAFTTDSAAQLIAQLMQTEGPLICPVAACATGLISVLQGAAMIHAGECDLCIVGSADAALRSSVLASFHRLQVLTRSADAATACRPFDVNRDGFVIGDGAAVLILESRGHARRRGVQPVAQVLGGGWLSDPTGITQMDESGLAVAELLSRCRDRTGFVPDVMSLHGTGTETNDLVEARGIVRACGDRLPVCFATKGASGHLLGAAGSVETALLTAGIVNSRHPRTVNLSSQDPRCVIPAAATSGAVSAGSIWGKLSLGFGGHVACGLFRGE